MSKIEWTDKTWNPIIGCSKISEGCQDCYAEKMAARIINMTLEKQNETHLNYCEILNDNLKWNGQTVFCQNMIEKPLYWKIPRKIFVCSMGDLFHEKVSFEWIDKIMAIIAMNPHHIFQILTKRPGIALKYFKSRNNDKSDIWDYMKDYCYDFIHLWDNNNLPENWMWIKTIDENGFKDSELLWEGEWPLKNLWMGATIENEKEKHRILDLLKIPAKIHFISCEPLLSNIDLYPWLEQYISPSESGHNDWLKGLDWVIAGCESGPNARPTHPDWVRSIQYQCQMANIPFFFKQWGTNRPFEQTAQLPFYRDVCTGKEFDSHGMNFIDPYTSEMGRFRGHQWLDWPFIDDCIFLKIHNHKKYTDYNMIDGKRYLEFPKIDSN